LQNEGGVKLPSSYRRLLMFIVLILAGLSLCSSVFASSIGMLVVGASAEDPAVPILVALVFIAFVAALGGYVMRRIGQPAVLGELLVGMLVANLAYVFHQPILTVLREGPVILTIVNQALTHSITLSEAAQQILPHAESSRRVVEILGSRSGIAAVMVYQFVDQLGRIAVIFLLFLVGLETSLREMKRVGMLAFGVAVVGVACPWLLGIFVLEWLEPGASFAAHLFVAGILTATSVAISARVFRDLGQEQRGEARIVLGAAVIDDILGLVILAVATALVVHGAVGVGFVAAVTARAVLFLLASVGIGIWITPLVLKKLARFHVANLYLLFGVGLAFVFSWLATLFGLATIVGAFAAGIVLEDFFRDKIEEGHSLRGLLSPLESLIVPIYFVLMGMQVKLDTFASSNTLSIAAALTVVAIAGKLVSGIVCLKRYRWLAIGVAMVPRGEVGLIFASIGRSLGVVSDAVFSAVVAMVLVTTFIAPPFLKMTLHPES
jgi:Na+:H+ antiporter